MEQWNKELKQCVNVYEEKIKDNKELFKKKQELKNKTYQIYPLIWHF